MTYTVLARRYRSRDFDEIVAQEPIARTLQNAIESDRTAHAYLFTGTRGVGKTSMARIFAKALNVDPSLGEAEAIGEAILRGDDLDVIEIDGASNRGIQEARDLIAGSGLSPTRCRYKIYIIDEVHMLTREAFNALLKTMEEPPEHVKFILCTTEAHKVPATIQSRCQRFDFRPLATPRIADQLRHILASESIEADDDVVVQVARLGHGSMRDALSLLDRLLAAGEPKLTSELLNQLLGMPDQAAVAGLVDAIADGKPDEALQAAHELLASGTSVMQALELLTDAFRNMMVIATCGAESDLLELTADALETAQQQAARFDAPALVHMIAVCDAVSRNARGSSTARALFDAAIVRLCLTEQLADIATLLAGGAKDVTPTSKPASKPAPPPKKKDPEPLKPAPAEATAEAPAETPAPTPASGDELWATVETFARRSESDHAKIEHLRYKSFDSGRLHLAVDEEGAQMARFLAGQAPRIAELVKRATGRSVKISIDTSTIATARQKPPPREVASDEAKTLPAVAEAMEVFDGTVIDVQDIGEEKSDV